MRTLDDFTSTEAKNKLHKHQLRSIDAHQDGPTGLPWVLESKTLPSVSLPMYLILTDWPFCAPGPLPALTSLILTPPSSSLISPVAFPSFFFSFFSFFFSFSFFSSFVSFTESSFGIAVPFSPFCFLAFFSTLVSCGDFSSFSICSAERFLPLDSSAISSKRLNPCYMRGNGHRG